MKKAYRYDDDIIFYFDASDNKYVAKEGSLAWRLNNPGLLLSHSLHRTGHKSIGAYHQYAIFPHLTVGKEALKAWITSTKYYSPLIEIAKYYQPNDPKKYLGQLHAMTGYSADIKPSSLSLKDFDKLVKAICYLAGFSPENEHQLKLLPKIIARLYSPGRKVEFYLAGYEHLLTKQDAIGWLEAHYLDAVVVHKSNGEFYLRSRPGHHLNQIRLKQEEYGVEKEFKDIVREIGQAQEGQCVWGFINGIFNTPMQALKSASLISQYTGNQHVLSLINDGGLLGNLPDAAMQKIGIHNKIIKFGAQFFEMLVKISDSHLSADKPPVIVFAHSQGALIAHLALTHLDAKIKQRIRIFTLGGVAFIEPGEAHSESHNYFSIADPVAKLASYGLCMLILRLHEGNKMGLSQDQILENLIQEDVDNHLATHDPYIIDKFKADRQIFYKNELEKSQNVTLIDQNISGFLEHTLSIPCYQKVLKDIIDKYRR